MKHEHADPPSPEALIQWIPQLAAERANEELDPDSELSERVTAAITLLRRRAAAPLLEVVVNPDPKTRCEALHWLRFIDDPRAFEAIIRALDDPVAEVRARAVASLPVGKAGQRPGSMKTMAHAFQSLLLILVHMVLVSVIGAILFAVLGVVICLFNGWDRSTFVIVFIGAALGPILLATGFAVNFFSGSGPELQPIRWPGPWCHVGLEQLRQRLADENAAVRALAEHALQDAGSPDRPGRHDAYDVRS